MKPTKNSMDIEEPIEINTKEQELLTNAASAQTIQTVPLVQTQNSSLETKFDAPNTNILSESIQQTNNGFNVAGMTIDTLNLLQVIFKK